MNNVAASAASDFRFVFKLFQLQSLCLKSYLAGKSARTVAILPFLISALVAWVANRLNKSFCPQRDFARQQQSRVHLILRKP